MNDTVRLTVVVGAAEEFLGRWEAVERAKKQRLQWRGGFGNMKKAQQEIDEHRRKITSLMNQLAEEYGHWNGWTAGIGRYVALGEYILEETPPGLPHDEWLDDARRSFLKWKEVHHISMTPPPNLKA